MMKEGEMCTLYRSVPMPCKKELSLRAFLKEYALCESCLR